MDEFKREKNIKKFEKKEKVNVLNNKPFALDMGSFEEKNQSNKIGLIPRVSHPQPVEARRVSLPPAPHRPGWGGVAERHQH